MPVVNTHWLRRGVSGTSCGSQTSSQAPLGPDGSCAFHDGTSCLGDDLSRESAHNPRLDLPHCLRAVCSRASGRRSQPGPPWFTESRGSEQGRIRRGHGLAPCMCGGALQAVTFPPPSPLPAETPALPEQRRERERESRVLLPRMCSGPSLLFSAPAASVC